MMFSPKPLGSKKRSLQENGYVQFIPSYLGILEGNLAGSEDNRNYEVPQRRWEPQMKKGIHHHILVVDVLIQRKWKSSTFYCSLLKFTASTVRTASRSFLCPPCFISGSRPNVWAHRRKCKADNSKQEVIRELLIFLFLVLVFLHFYIFLKALFKLGFQSHKYSWM